MARKKRRGEAEDVLRPASPLPLTEKCHHYTRLDSVPEELQKYWQQRFDLFSIYNDGIYLTDDAWFGVTPETVALQIAQDLPELVGVAPENAILVDLFAGVGGNTIQFALSGRWKHVIGIERDADTLACAQHNLPVFCEGYDDDNYYDGDNDGDNDDDTGGRDLHDKWASMISWIHGDCFDFLERLRSRPDTLDPALQSLLFSSSSSPPSSSSSSSLSSSSSSSSSPSVISKTPIVLFASPPWGGVAYRDQPVFNLSTMAPYNLEALYAACRHWPHALYLPRTSDLQQIADVMATTTAPQKRKTHDNDSSPGHGRLDVVHYCIRRASKAMVVYHPGEAQL